MIFVSFIHSYAEIHKQSGFEAVELQRRQRNVSASVESVKAVVDVTRMLHLFGIRQNELMMKYTKCETYKQLYHKQIIKN